MEFTEEEIRIIAPFFTNVDKSVFALRNLPEVVKGALFSRYSRTDKSLRRVLLDEFIKRPEMGFSQIVSFSAERGDNETIAIKKAEEFYDRVLVGYGDDSVAELGGVHIACENVSNIASKVLEDPRIGLSPLEKSTRYVWFNQKVGGQYKYYREPLIMQSEFADLYEEINDMLFDAYSELVEPMSKFVMESFPQSDASDRAYKSAVKAKACDIIRVFLPASALTNLGIFGNGRAFEYLLMKMHANSLTEIKTLAAEMQTELEKVIPSFVKRTNDRYGKEQQKFINETDEELERLAKRVLHTKEESESVSLVDYDRDAVDKVVAMILYQYSQHSLGQIKEKVNLMDEHKKNMIIQKYVERRQNRRHRPGRAFEATYYTFDLLGNYGIYRDLQRHRMLTQMRQLLSTDYGYDVPKELVEAGFSDVYHQCTQRAKEAFEEIRNQYPKEAQYVVPLGFRIRWLFKMNLREVYHLVELRTMQQGHPDYRKMCQVIFQKVKAIHPQLVEHLRFADMNDYGLERVEAEKKLDKKMEEIKRKYG